MEFACSSRLNVSSTDAVLLHSTSSAASTHRVAPSSFSGQKIQISVRREVSHSRVDRSAVRTVRASGTDITESRGLTRDGATQGGKWMSSTTRHVRLYVGYIDPATNNMDQQQLDKLSIMIDPDNEFLWPEEKLQKVFDYFTELVDNYAGAPLTEYTLRLIGSDVEHYIRKLLLAGEIQYNLNCRVLNFSMGQPRYEGLEVEVDAE